MCKPSNSKKEVNQTEIIYYFPLFKNKTVYTWEINLHCLNGKSIIITTSLFKLEKIVLIQLELARNREF